MRKKPTKICTLIVREHYNQNLTEIFDKLHVDKYPDHLFYVLDKFDNFSFSADNVFVVKNDYRGIINGYNQMIDLVKTKHKKSVTNFLFISEEAKLSDDPLAILIDRLDNVDRETSIYTARLKDLEKGLSYEYLRNSFLLKYRATVLTTNEEYNTIHKPRCFSTVFFCMPAKTVYDYRLNDKLYTLKGCNFDCFYGESVVAPLNKIICDNKPYEIKMNNSDLYYFFRNNIILQLSRRKAFSFDPFMHLLEEEILIHLLFYKYNTAKAILFAVLDGYKHVKAIASADASYLDSDINRINYYLWNQNELRLRFDDEMYWGGMSPIAKELFVINKENYGYIDEFAEDYAIVDIYNPVPYTTFNVKEILNWSIEDNNGYITSRDQDEIDQCLELLQEIKNIINPKNRKIIIKQSLAIHKPNHKNVKYSHDFSCGLLKKKQLIDEARQELLAKDINVNPKKVVFYVGTRLGVCCNPKYVLNEIIQRNLDYELVWIAHKPEMCQELLDKNVKVVPLIDSDQVLEQLCEAKIIIYNDSLPITFVPRNDQVLINTWHGAINYKKIGYDGEIFNNDVEKELFKLVNPSPKYMVAGSEAFINSTSMAFGFKKEIFIKTGLPRNDVLFSKVDKNELKRKLGLPLNKKICVYAPTFRKDNVASIFGLDLVLLKKSLQERFSGNWIVVFRGHVFTVNFWSDQGFIDLTNYPDQQELLLVADVVVSDYSSIMWDASLRRIPVFIYCPDYCEYMQYERSFAFDMKKVPYPLCMNNNELAAAIINFDENKYLEDIEKHHHDCVSYDKGDASKQIVDLVIKETEL